MINFNSLFQANLVISIPGRYRKEDMDVYGLASLKQLSARNYSSMWASRKQSSESEDATSSVSTSISEDPIVFAQVNFSMYIILYQDTFPLSCSWKNQSE